MNTKFIDLGLPSGTLWADRNLGAEKPEDYGDYFRFGETIPFTEDSPDYITKPFGKDISSTIYDAAMSYNINSCIPNTEQFYELLELCSYEWGERNNIAGVTITGINKNKIFLPAAGCKVSKDLIEEQGRIISFSSSIHKHDGSTGFMICDCFWDDSFHQEYYGYPIRPVLFNKNINSKKCKIDEHKRE